MPVYTGADIAIASPPLGQPPQDSSYNRRSGSPDPTPCALRPSPMPIGKLTIELSIPHAQSLKDRRQVVRSLKDKLRHTFNLSVAEMNEGGTIWNQATVAVAVISSSMQSLTQHLESIDKAAHRISNNLSAEVADSYAEILND